MWARHKQGLTESQASAWWQQFYDDPNVARDNSGYGGAECIYICKGKALTNRTEVYVDGRCETQSKLIKNPQEKDVSALKNFAHESVESHGSDFFRNAGLVMAKSASEEGDAKKANERMGHSKVGH